MRLSRTTVHVLALVITLAGAGCIENMGDLKAALGVAGPAPQAPLYAPPLAKAQVDLTQAYAGEPVRFTSEGTRDPQGLPLTYVWEFGDGTIGAGETALHAFALPGEHTARLIVTSAAGLKDEATITLRVVRLDLAPTAAIWILDAKGASISRAMMGDALTFDAVAADPEGGALTLDWDFGDGATSHGARVTRSYATPGAYDVRLTAKDASGQVALATARLLVDGAWRAEGAFEPARATSADAALVVPGGAREVTATLRYPAGFGVNDIEVALLDATGAKIGASEGSAEPGAQGDATRTVALDAGALASAKDGAWTARIVQESGLGVTWTLDIAVKM